MKNVIIFIVFSQQANGGPIAHYTFAASSNTATRVSHCNKLMFINSLFLIIFNNLHILHCKVQILAFQQEIRRHFRRHANGRVIAQPPLPGNATGLIKTSAQLAKGGLCRNFTYYYVLIILSWRPKGGAMS